MRKRKSLQYYKGLLPNTLTVEINRVKEGVFWAKVKELPHCYTQAKDFAELVDMINDAVYTYLEIPKRFRGKVGYYLPKKILQALQELREEIKRKQWERVIREISDSTQLRRKTEVFSLS